MQSQPPVAAESLTRTRIVGGHTRARRLDTAYATFLVLGVCMGTFSGLYAFDFPFDYSSSLWLRMLSGIVFIPVALAMVFCIPACFLCLWVTIRNLTHWPLPALALLGAATIFAATLLDTNGRDDAIAWVVLALAAVYILVPLGWFTAGRRRMLAERFVVRELSARARRGVCYALVTAGATGCIALPLIWGRYYSKEGIGGWTSGPVTLILLGFVLSVALIAFGLARIPERRARRDR